MTRILQRGMPLGLQRNNELSFYSKAICWCALFAEPVSILFEGIYPGRLKLFTSPYGIDSRLLTILPPARGVSLISAKIIFRLLPGSYEIRKGVRSTRRRGVWSLGRKLFLGAQRNKRKIQEKTHYESVAVHSVAVKGASVFRLSTVQRGKPSAVCVAKFSQGRIQA